MNLIVFCFFILFSIQTSVLSGTQIFKSKTKDKPYWQDPIAFNFVQNYLLKAIPLKSDAEVLKYALEQVQIPGAYIELGVWRGITTNFIAGLNPHRTIYGFDSFQGLPEDWDKGTSVLPKSTFAWSENQALPHFALNVVLCKGLFIDSLPCFVREILHDQSIAFLHVDCDLYSSTATGLGVLGNNLCDGSIIVFDELYNYSNYAEHEWKAFQEFLEAFSFEAEYLAYNMVHEQVAVRLKKKPLQSVGKMQSR